jgi:Cu/Zn superoxide dismutase
MLLALVLACAKHGGDDQPYSWNYDDQPSYDEAEDRNEQRDDDALARDERDTPTTSPGTPGGDGELGGLGLDRPAGEPEAGIVTRSAFARLEPKGGSSVTGTVTFTETVSRIDAIDPGYPSRPDYGATGSMDESAGGSVGASGADTSGSVGMETAGGAIGSNTPPADSTGTDVAGGAGGVASGAHSPTAGTMPREQPGMGGSQPEGMDHHRMGDMGDAGRTSTVRVVIDLQNAPPGDHAIVIHEKGDCSGPDAANVGNRFDPLAGQQQGTGLGVSRYSGDLGNLTVDENGRGHKELTTAGFTLGTDGGRSVNGLAVVVHENRDDGSQPSGNVGKALACGVISAQVASR